MIENLLHPTLLARVLSGLAALGATVVATAVGVQVLRARGQAARGSEEGIALERRSELAAMLVQAAMVFQLVNAVLSVVTADRLSPSVQGAMCAYGVLDLGASGFVMLGVTLASALACALWLALHRYDLRLPTATLSPVAWRALLGVAPLMALDFALTLRFALSLDLSVVASCCASQLDPEVAATMGAQVGLPRIAFGVALAVCAACVAVAVAIQRRDHGALVGTLGVLSTLACCASVPSIMGFVAPHAYGSPVHTCPFCLLHADVWGIGWPLFSALFAGLTLGLTPSLVRGLSRVAGEREQARALERDAARFAGYAFAVLLVFQLVPVVRYLAASGGASVFGGAL
ncbi:MAG: hypothetical protein R3B40_15470 [Polyangiales bacterium]